MDLWSISSVFTPSVLFVVVNLVIGAIAVISTRRHGSAGGRPIDRSSSSSNVLERVRSLGLFRFRSGDLPPIANHDGDDGMTTHQQDDRDDTSRSQEYEIGRGEDQRQQQQFRRIHSESDSKAKKEEEEAEESNMMKMKKSVSSMMSWRSGEVAAATRPRREASLEEEVDAKADDFINRFKQQLKLQRLDSILRYREMLSNKN